MPFWRQIRSNSTSDGVEECRPVNTLPLSVNTSSGTPWSRMASTKWPHTARDRACSSSPAQTQNLEWSSIPVRALSSVPSDKKIPPTTSSCHSSIGR